jgi:hypothetical protein
VAVDVPAAVAESKRVIVPVDTDGTITCKTVGLGRITAVPMAEMVFHSNPASIKTVFHVKNCLSIHLF